MINRGHFINLLFLILFLLCVSCAGSPGTGVPASASSSEAAGGTGAQAEPADGINQAEPDPVYARDLVFHPAEFPSLAVPPGVGLVTRDAKNLAASLSDKDKAALSDSFRTAYIDNLLRAFPLAGVLGGDMVHGWPDNNPSGWVQNWSTSEPAANSWWLPSLVLAIRGLATQEAGGETAGNRVFVVRGKLLDQYGKSAGINGANGNTGYGSPRGYEFLYEGKLAQRFDLGLITVDKDGRASFLPETPPSQAFDPPSDIGVFRSAGASGADVRLAFLAAWKMALDRNIKTMTSDGPGQYLSFSGASFDFPGGDTVKGLYLQTFNQRTAVLILPDSSLLPFYPRLIMAPFLDLLLGSAGTPPGAESLKALDIQFSGADDFSRALMKGLSLYGIPLTDPMPLKSAATPGGAGTQTAWQLGQRFSRGWLAGS